MKHSRGFALPVLLSILAFSGCVSGKLEVRLEVPAQEAQASLTKGVVVVDRIVDARTFQNNPEDPSTPSTASDAALLTAEQKQTLVGRHWDKFKAPVCELVLPKGETVNDWMFALLSEGFARRGYLVKREGPGEIHAEVRIDRFWGYSSCVPFKKTMESDIVCTLTLRKEGQVRTLVIMGRGLRDGQLATSEYWQAVYRRGFRHFLKHLDESLGQAGY